MVLGGHGSWAWWTLASPKGHSIKVSACSQAPFWDQGREQTWGRVSPSPRMSRR